MRIERIDVYRLDLPYSGGVYALSSGRRYVSFDATLVRVVTACGLEGWGESTPFGATYVAAHAAGVRAGLAEIAPAVLGLDPRLSDRLNDAMDEALVGHPHAKTPIDVACWDIFGQAVGLPVCDLLGGRVAGPVPVISSIHAGDPEDMRARVADHRARGYKGHSIKIGAAESEGGPALDAERVRACLADRAPGEWFLVDANGGMSLEQALRFLALLPPGLDFVLEAPCATWRETLSLRRRSALPILWDELLVSEADLAQLIALDGADGVGLKISKQGGLTRSRRQRDSAIAAGLVVSVQETTGSTIAFAALLHLAQSTPRHFLRCALDCRDMVTVETADFDAPIRHGGVEAPTLPGLGLAVRQEVLGEPVAVYAA